MEKFKKFAARKKWKVRLLEISSAQLRLVRAHLSPYLHQENTPGFQKVTLSSSALSPRFPRQVKLF
jgi:hypothetical protein